MVCKHVSTGYSSSNVIQESPVFTEKHALTRSAESGRYRIRRIIGSVFNLAVWRIIFNPPNLNNAFSGQ